MNGMEKERQSFLPFLSACQKTTVIANQPAGWCGDPPNLRETYVFRVENVAFNRGIP